MESNWSKRFLYSNGKRRVNPIVFIFVSFQILLLIVAIANILQLNNDGIPDDDMERYKMMPELTISGLADKATFLEKAEIESIQKKVFEIVSENESTISVNKVKAVIRNDNVHANDFNGRTKYINMVIDIPSLEQSYEVFYSSNAVIDPDVSTFVFCLEESQGSPYENFDCKSSDSKMFSRYDILKAYLGYFSFDLFSTFISPSDPNTIVISPSVTYNNSDTAKTGFINETKGAIESLGLNANIYNYYVRTAADVNYNNNGK